MSRKPDGTERSGRGTAPSAAGGFGGADTALSRLARPFVPKPFRSLGGMSASADTMLSIGMGRHNNDDELPEDQVNIAGIVDRKVSDRRYLPRKLKNMQYYLHTTPINEALSMDDSVLYQRSFLYETALNNLLQRLHEEGIGDFISNAVSSVKSATDYLDPALSTAAALVPFGDLYYGYKAVSSLGDIYKQVEKVHEILKRSGTDIDLSESPEENEQVIKDMQIPSAADRALLKDVSMKVSIDSYKFLRNIISAIPGEILGLGAADTAVDLSLTAATVALDSAIDSIESGDASTDPDGEKLADSLYSFSKQYLDTLKSVEDQIISLGKRIGVDEKTLEKTRALSNFIGNLAMLHNNIVNNIKQNKEIEDLEVFAEARRKKKKKTDEMSTTGGVAGYTGPLTGPRSPKQFYDTMARVAGGEYLIDPAKNLKVKP